MADSRRLAFALCWLLAVASVGPWLSASGAVAHSSAGVASTPAPERPAVDNTVTRISVRASGNATWAVEVRTRLETETDVERYRAFQERFRNNTSRYLDTYRERIGSVVADAGRVTDREMRATNFSATTRVQEVPRRWGVVTYRFEWTNFAERANATALAVGDVFRGGYYLDEDDIFAVEAPDGYAVETASPAPDEAGTGAVRWFGPHDFADQRPRVVFRANESGRTTSGPESDATTDGAGTDGRESSDDADGVPENLLAGAALVALGVGAAAVWRRRSGGAPVEEVGASDESSDPPSLDESATVKTDDEKVEALLRERGGRMKQAEVAEALDWSASKTSRVLSDLEDDGAVERVRIGRENVVDLSDGTDE